MSEELAWVKWWAFPWTLSHPDWSAFEPGPQSLSSLYRSHCQALNETAGIAAGLPARPNDSTLRLALASAQQIALALALVDNVRHPHRQSSLDDDHKLWCTRFAKALPPDTSALSEYDALNLLYHWVEPEVWQRIRLRFSRKRVLEYERHDRLIDPQRRLDTLWHAVIWRATAAATPPNHSRHEEIDDALPT